MLRAVVDSEEIPVKVGISLSACMNYSNDSLWCHFLRRVHHRALLDWLLFTFSFQRVNAGRRDATAIVERVVARGTGVARGVSTTCSADSLFQINY